MIYPVIQTSQNLVINILVARKAKRSYPQYFGGRVEPLEDEDKKGIVKNTIALIFNRAGSLIINCTDNIVISAFAGVGAVGLYSNYFTLKNMVNTFTTMFPQSLTASIGNLNAMEGTQNKQKLYDTFNQIFFMNYFLHAFCTICLVCLLEPFIYVWIGDSYIMGVSIVLIVSLNFYFLGVQKTAEQFKAACGLYWQDRFRVFIESIINIVVSIILAKDMGVLGVLLGTFVSNLLVTAWVEPYIVFKYALERPFFPYIQKNTIYFCVTAILTLGIFWTEGLIFKEFGGIGQFILRTAMTVTMAAGALVAIFFRNPYFKNTLELGKHYTMPFIKKIKRRIR